MHKTSNLFKHTVINRERLKYARKMNVCSIKLNKYSFIVFYNLQCYQIWKYMNIYKQNVK